MDDNHGNLSECDEYKRMCKEEAVVLGINLRVQRIDSERFKVGGSG